MDKLYLNNLYKGLVVKNYKEMCILLNVKEKSGESKNCQLNNWKRCFEYEKDGHKYIINKLYDNPLKKIDGRSKSSGGKGNNYKVVKDNKFIISEDDSLKCGVYIILLDNNVYIGSTTTSFKNRFKQHKTNYNGLMEHTYNLIKNGGKFSALWIADVNQTELNIREKEQYFINKYLNDKNYLLINKRNERNPINKIKKIKFENIKVQKDKINLLIDFLETNDIIYKIN